MDIEPTCHIYAYIYKHMYLLSFFFYTRAWIEVSFSLLFSVMNLTPENTVPNKFFFFWYMHTNIAKIKTSIRSNKYTTYWYWFKKEKKVTKRKCTCEECTKMTTIRLSTNHLDGKTSPIVYMPLLFVLHQHPLLVLQIETLHQFLQIMQKYWNAQRKRERTPLCFIVH